MKKKLLKFQELMDKAIRFFAIVFISIVPASCKVVGEVFKAGLHSGIFLVVFIVGLIIILVIWLSRKKN